MWTRKSLLANTKFAQDTAAYLESVNLGEFDYLLENATRQLTYAMDLADFYKVPDNRKLQVIVTHLKSVGIELDYIRARSILKLWHEAHKEAELQMSL